MYNPGDETAGAFPSSPPPLNPDLPWRRHAFCPADAELWEGQRDYLKIARGGGASNGDNASAGDGSFLKRRAAGSITRLGQPHVCTVTTHPGVLTWKGGELDTKDTICPHIRDARSEVRQKPVVGVALLQARTTRGEDLRWGRQL